MKKTLIPLGISLLLSVAAIVMILTTQSKTSKIAFIRNPDVFEAFKGKQELEAKLLNTQNQHRAILDSMSVELTTLQTGNINNKAQLVSLQTKEKQFQHLNQQFSTQFTSQSTEFTEQIWGQINQYITDFGKEYGYDYILGATGNGSLMYAGKGEDITDKIIEYINKRYEGL